MAKKILIIEDEEIIFTLIQKKLSQLGYNVFVSRDGQDGLEAMRREKPDLVLLDMVMPKLGGLEVLEQKARERELKNIPVIVISNSGQPVEIDRAQKLGAKDWLVKTEFDPQEVVDKVIKQIGK